MKKYVWLLSVGAVILMVGAFLLGKYVWPETGMATLPAPELSEGQRGELGIDKNVNESTIDSYLGRSDAVYRDLRMLKAPADYAREAGIKVYRMMFAEVKKSSLHEAVNYYPSFAVVSRGKVVAALQADSDADAPAYNDYDAFKEWAGRYLAG